LLQVTYKFSHCHYFTLTILVAMLSKDWACCRSLAGIAGSNPAEGMIVRPLCLTCVV